MARRQSGPRGEGGIVALALAGLAQVLAEIAHCAGHADIGLVEDTPRRTGHQRARGNGADGQRHIGRHDDRVRTGALGNPFVGRVEGAGDDDDLHHRIA